MESQCWYGIEIEKKKKKKKKRIQIKGVDLLSYEAITNAVVKAAAEMLSSFSSITSWFDSFIP